MSEIGDAIDEVRDALADAAEEFMPDTCTITKRAFSEGGSSGDTMIPTATITNLPCTYKSLGSRSQIVVGGEARLASHRLRFPATSDTMAINSADRVTIAARGTHPEMVFHEPVLIDGSMAVFVEVAATLVQEGFDQA
jgi:hypothetical protein